MTRNFLYRSGFGIMLVAALWLSLANALPAPISARLDIGDGPDTPRSDSSPPRAVTGEGLPVATDEEFVADSGGHLDQYLFYLDVPDGLKFTINLDRYYSRLMDFNADGTLKNAGELIDKGLLPRTALLRLRVYDVDHDSTYDGDGDGVPDPEVDYVYVNGHQVVDSYGLPKKLTSGNDTWSVWSAEIPIEWLKFPQSKGSESVPPAAVPNEIKIDIDVGGAWQYGDGGWAVEVDWGALRIDADLRPTVLVHGYTGDVSDGYWDSWYDFPDGGSGYLWEEGIPGRIVQLEPCGSINANADDLAVDIAKFKTEYGVDKVHIVGHSKGGLDSRAYIREHNDVEILVQLGTPNGGSFGAEMALLGRIITDNAFLEYYGMLHDPALTEISITYMTFFNLFTGKNPNTKYVVYAGNHDSDVSWTDWFAGAGYLPGEDDKAVRVASAHALDWFDVCKEFKRELPDESATHNRLKEDNYALFQLVLQELRNVDSVSTCEDTAESRVAEAEEPLDQTVTVASVIHAAQTLTEDILVDQADSLTLQVMWGEGDLDVAIYTPLGERIDPAVAETRDDVIYTDSKELLGLAHVTYDIKSPLAGVWTVETSAVDVGDGRVYYISAFLEGAKISLMAEPDQPFYNTGEAIGVSAHLTEDGVGVGGANLTADVRKPDGSVASFSLTEVGGGYYTASFDQTVQEGYYDFSISATGTTVATGSFSRSAFFNLSVAAGASTLGASHSDYPYDPDVDGIYEALNTVINLNIVEAGTYGISGTLEDSLGHQIHTASTSGSLSAGSQQLVLSFDGAEIFANGVDGPYYVRDLYLAKTSSDTLMPIDIVPDAHTTSAYSYMLFQPTAIALTNNHTDVPVDVDGDGVYDYLNVGLEVSVLSEGYYDLNAQLVDGNGDTIVWATVFDAYLSGLGTVNLLFSGEQIGEHGVDGPYYVRDLSISKTDGTADQIFDEVHTTQAYSASDFRPNRIYLPLIFRSYGEAPPSEGLYGHVTDNGLPVAGTQLLLRYYNGLTWSTYATTYTNSSGDYQFSNPPVLGSGQNMYVRWSNYAGDDSRLSSWSCYYLDAASGPEARECNFDLDNIVLDEPSHDSYVWLPTAFTWNMRAIATDSYEVNLADMGDYVPYWWMEVGHADSYVLNSLPSGFDPYTLYGWWMWVYGPDGYGVSYYYHSITFMNSGRSVGVQAIPSSHFLAEDRIEMSVPRNRP